MSFDKLTANERNHIRRAHSQALYYAQRGFFDACRLNIAEGELSPEVRSKLTGLVGEFLCAYIIPELAYLVQGGEATEGDGLTKIAPPIDF
jgi:hypothetical protein